MIRSAIQQIDVRAVDGNGPVRIAAGRAEFAGRELENPVLDRIEQLSGARSNASVAGESLKGDLGDHAVYVGAVQTAAEMMEPNGRLEPTGTCLEADHASPTDLTPERSDPNMEEVNVESGSILDHSRIERPNCLNRDVCEAKGHGVHCRRCSVLSVRGPEHLARWKASPEGKRIQRERAIERAAIMNSPEGKAKRAAQRAERAFGWCPEHRRDEYRRLAQIMGAAEAKRIILEDEATQAARKAAA